MTAIDVEKLQKLEGEIARRLVDGGDDAGQVAKDTGAPLSLVHAVRMLPATSED